MKVQNIGKLFPDKSRVLFYILSLFVSVFAFYLCFKVGHIGAFVEDDMVFYGGWQVLNGDFPFIDSFGSNPVFVVVIQGLFFYLFGVNWTAFVLHGAIFNALWVLLVIHFLRLLGLGRVWCLAYGAAAAYSYYTAVGFAHPDKDSFLFLLAALNVQILALRESEFRRIVVLYVAASVLLVLAFLCKQNPSVLYPLAAAMPLFALGGRRIVAAAAGIGISVLLVAAAVAVVTAFHPTFASDAFYYLFTLPAGYGADRVAAKRFPSVTKFATWTHYATMNLALAMIVAGMVLLWTKRSMRRSALYWQDFAVPVGLAFVFMVITFFHLTNIAQVGASHVTLVILAVGAPHAAIFRSSAGEAPTDSARHSRLLMSVLILAFVLIDAREYHRLHSKRRMYYDTPMTGHVLPQGYAKIRGFENVQWMNFASDTGELYLKSRRELMATLDAIKGNVVIDGFWPAWYALAGKAPVSPAFMVLPHHTTPPPGTPQWDALLEHFRKNVTRDGVEHVVVSRVSKDDLGADATFMERQGVVCGRTDKTYLSVLRMCPGWTDDTAVLTLLLSHQGKQR